MPKKLLFILLICFNFAGAWADLFESTKDLPVAYQGRFRSLESASKLWLFDLYHKDRIKKEDRPLFHSTDGSSLELLWKLHFLGHKPYDHSPFFWIHYADVKTLLGLNPLTDRFTYSQLSQTNLMQSASSPHKSLADEIAKLQQNFQLFQRDDDNTNTLLVNLVKELQALKKNPQQMAQTVESRLPLLQRLQHAGTTLKLLPARQLPGEWLSLHALKTQVYDLNSEQVKLTQNFTLFNDTDFHRLQSSYLSLENSAKNFYANESSEKSLALEHAIDTFVATYNKAYASLIQMPSQVANGKKLKYPSFWQLQAETYYHRLPLIELTLACYLGALLLFVLGRKTQKWGMGLLALGFLLHTAVMALRCFVLQRPPVSNMFETVIYVPWIAMGIGFIFYFTSGTRYVLYAACAASLALLILLKITHVDARLENVQAVLDSQYWLIVHVLMVVGSYGAFIVCGILAHFYLVARLRQEIYSAYTQSIAKGILHTMYVGVALLIPGTILGGIWAAESWGRFWDWDPKESWAFISACVYLLIIHAYTFKRIKDLGLAIGAIGGLMAISFTWYGVNYILGTGLHSYGFGTGGEKYYFLYLFAEMAFVLSSLLYINNKKLLEKK